MQPMMMIGWYHFNRTFSKKEGARREGREAEEREREKGEARRGQGMEAGRIEKWVQGGMMERGARKFELPVLPLPIPPVGATQSKLTLTV